MLHWDLPCHYQSTEVDFVVTEMYHCTVQAAQKETLTSIVLHLHCYITDTVTLPVRLICHMQICLVQIHNVQWAAAVSGGCELWTVFFMTGFISLSLYVPLAKFSQIFIFYSLLVQFAEYTQRWFEEIKQINNYVDKAPRSWDAGCCLFGSSWNQY